MTINEWRAEAERLFGPDEMQWRFRCPACGHEASMQDYKDAGAKSENVGFSCIGRWLASCREAFGKGDGPCNYAGGGLFGLNPVLVTYEHGETRMFAFGEPIHKSEEV